MTTQLSLFDPPKERIKRIYTRDRNGRFATKEQAENDRLKRQVEYYKYKYEAEQRKNKPVVKALIEVQRKLQLLNNK